VIIEIDDIKTVGDMQDRFSLCFPGLKLELCRATHRWEEFSLERDFFPGSFHIGVIRKNHDSGSIEIKSWDKVGEVEKKFDKLFGLNVQICYQAGQHWIQTGKSDNLTIGELQKKSYERL